MAGKIIITRTGYDPEFGKHIKDPYLGPNPSLGAAGRMSEKGSRRATISSSSQASCGTLTSM